MGRSVKFLGLQPPKASPVPSLFTGGGLKFEYLKKATFSKPYIQYVYIHLIVDSKTKASQQSEQIIDEF